MTSHASREFMEKPMGHFQYSTSSIYVTIFIYCRQCANISEHRKWYWNFYWHKSWFEVSTSRTYSDAVVPLGHKLFYVDITFSICSFFWGGDGNVLKHHLLIHISITWASLLSLHIGDSLLLFLSKMMILIFHNMVFGKHQQHSLTSFESDSHTVTPPPPIAFAKTIFVQILWWMIRPSFGCEWNGRKWLIRRGDFNAISILWIWLFTQWERRFCVFFLGWVTTKTNIHRTSSYLRSQ